MENFAEQLRLPVDSAFVLKARSRPGLRWEGRADSGGKQGGKNGSRAVPGSVEHEGILPDQAEGSQEHFLFRQVIAMRGRPVDRAVDLFGIWYSDVMNLV